MFRNSPTIRPPFLSPSSWFKRGCRWAYIGDLRKFPTVVQLQVQREGHLLIALKSWQCFKIVSRSQNSLFRLSFSWACKARPSWGCGGTPPQDFFVFYTLSDQIWYILTTLNKTSQRTFSLAVERDITISWCPEDKDVELLRQSEIELQFLTSSMADFNASERFIRQNSTLRSRACPADATCKSVSLSYLCFLRFLAE